MYQDRLKKFLWLFYKLHHLKKKKKLGFSLERWKKRRNRILPAGECLIKIRIPGVFIKPYCSLEEKKLYFCNFFGHCLYLIKRFFYLKENMVQSKIHVSFLVTIYCPSNDVLQQLIDHSKIYIFFECRFKHIRGGV